MRQVVNINQKWAFSKEASAVPQTMPEKWYWVTLPHTWNAIDGQDGGSDYYRGTCYYAKTINTIDLPEAEKYFLEFNGANASADVYVNGKNLCHHDGGYSTFRIDITDALTPGENLIAVAVDNSVNDTVYPQQADFTFYGGLYRDVNIIAVSASHFDLEYYGAPGIMVTPKINGADADIDVEVFLKAAGAQDALCICIKDADGNVVDEKTVPASQTKVTFAVKDVHLWNGRKDPYLYTACAVLSRGEEELDAVSARFGCRTFAIDPDKGFFLNGESYPLHGVSRHQDRKGIGNALLPCHHKEDIDLICEMGANTIRLAHYQHAQYFYDLCDERGLVIWAEIPYISAHMDNGRPNTISQMKELISQNYNHASIVVWGLSNEITMSAPSTPSLRDNHVELNDLVHKMDPTRLTTMAVVSMCSIDDPYLQIPDCISYNHYYGWYGGDTSMNGPFFDNFHKKYPTIPIGMSEYGCEALNWHTSDPKQGDYTEEYQAYYHEELIKQLFTRPFIWATHVWNMFDFAADARNEGGENGLNHKGLMTFDRKYKKDAFYAYKAWLSDDPFVHVCGKRYVDRVEDVTKVTVYSNLPEVELFANGKSLGKQSAPEHFFYFDVPNEGETTIKAVAGDCEDESFIRKVDEFNMAYRLVEQGAVLNWFDITEREGFLSLNSKLSSIMASPEAVDAFVAFLGSLPSAEAGVSMNVAGMMSASSPMAAMMGGFTALRMIGMAGSMGLKDPTKEQLLELNEKFNAIPDPQA